MIVGASFTFITSTSKVVDEVLVPSSTTTVIVAVPKASARGEREMVGAASVPPILICPSGINNWLSEVALMVMPVSPSGSSIVNAKSSRDVSSSID